MTVGNAGILPFSFSAVKSSIFSAVTWIRLVGSRAVECGFWQAHSL